MLNFVAQRCHCHSRFGYFPGNSREMQLYVIPLVLFCSFFAWFFVTMFNEQTSTIITNIMPKKSYLLNVTITIITTFITTILLLLLLLLSFLLLLRL